MTNTFAGAKLYIGTTLEVDFTSQLTALADFESDAYEEIKEISNVGEFGAAANIVQFPIVADKYVKKAKGTRNAGDPAIVVGYTAGDPGQDAVRAAEDTNFYYNFKLVLADAINENYSDTIVYFRALVAGKPRQYGGVEDFVTDTYALAIYPGPIEVPSEVMSPTSP
jgi:hypothetical protein